MNALSKAYKNSVLDEQAKLVETLDTLRTIYAARPEAKKAVSTEAAAFIKATATYQASLQTHVSILRGENNPLVEGYRPETTAPDDQQLTTEIQIVRGSDFTLAHFNRMLTAGQSFIDSQSQPVPKPRFPAAVWESPRRRLV